MATLEVIVDTSIIIDFLRGHRATIDLFSALLNRRSAGITAVTVFELQVGIEPDSRRDTNLGHLIDYLTVLPLDSAAAKIAGRIERQLRQDGRTIGVADILIAGICLRSGLPLATGNRAHFERVPGLNLYGAK